MHLNRFAITRINGVKMFMFQTFCVIICWVRIVQKVGYELVESGYETSEPRYKSSGYERSMGTKRLVTIRDTLIQWISRAFCKYMELDRAKMKLALVFRDHYNA